MASSGSAPKAARRRLPARTKRLVRDLKKDDFRIHPGYPRLSAKDACAKSYPPLHSCWGNNPVSPYVIPVVKAWPHEQVGPTPANAFGRVRSGYTPLPRLGPREAIVLYGKMPPPGKHMSVTSYVWSQPGHWKAKDYNKWANTSDRPYPMQYMFSTIPANDPKAGRTFSFSSLGDSLNNIIMQRRSGSPFGKKRYFIITPSATTHRAVRRALQAQGVPRSHIFTEQIPSRDKYGPIGPLGMGKDALDFLTFFRYAIPDNPQAANEWWANPPLTVMRVRAPSSLGRVQRYGRLTYGKRTARSEGHLADDLRSLVNAVCDRTSTSLHLTSADCAQPPPASSFVPATIDDFGWTGPYCRKINGWCGDQSDAGLYGTKPLPLDSGQIYAVVDTLATETRNAIYVGLSVNDASTFLAPTGVTDATLKGSADGYAAAVGHTSKFFVHHFTRKCGVLKGLLGNRLSQDCTRITKKMVPPKGDTSAPGHPALKGKFMAGLRDFIEPGTTRGPDTSKLLRPRILKFTKP